MKSKQLSDAAEIQGAEYTDEELVTKVLNGEKHWFEAIMRRHSQKLFRLLKAYVHNDGDAEELLQDSYVRAYEKLQQFQGTARFSTWLTRIVINEALARLRSRKRFVFMDDESVGEGFTATDPRLSPQSQAERVQLRRVLRHAVLALPPKYREVFVLREVDGLSTEETAQNLTIGEEAVKTRLFRARALLRARIGNPKEGHRFLG